MSEPVGYVVVAFNQASHRPETVTGTDVYWTAEDAAEEAEYQRAQTAKVGRRESYVVAALMVENEES